ncbi:MAG: TIR domain-containing protein, partial [Microcystaceae cyanobacterium]
MTDVFISYSRKDKIFVQTLHDALKASHRETWVDWENIPKGTEWWREIEAGIEGANTFIFVISPDSVASSVCGDEINYAIKNGKRFLPIVRRDVDFGQFEEINPSHQALKAHNWLFFREEDNFEQSFAGLVISLETDIDYVQQHTEILREAKKWENNQRNDSFLLQGEELAGAEKWLEEAEQRLKASELSLESDKKNPNPLLTEQQRNFILKSRENEDAKAKAERILREAKEKADRRTKISVIFLAVSLIGALIATAIAGTQTKIAQEKTKKADEAVNRAETVKQELSAKSKELEGVEKKRKAVEAKANQAENKLKLAGKNLTLAQGKLSLAQRQQQHAQKDAEKARQDKSLAQASLDRANHALIQANTNLQAAKEQKAKATTDLETAKLEKRRVEQQKADTELQRQATAIDVKAIQSEALVNQEKPFDGLLLA